MSSQTKQTLNSVLLVLYRAVLGIVMTGGVWLANEVYTDLKTLPRQTAEEVKALKLESVQVPLKFVTQESAQAAHEAIRADIVRHDARLTGVEHSQQTMIATQERMTGTLQRIEEHLENRK